jgi:uncharacterized protein (DUF433 family)
MSTGYVHCRLNPLLDPERYAADASTTQKLEGEPMNPPYVELNDGVYRVARTRISLDSLVYAYLNGQTAEAIAQSFPLLTLEQVYGALTFYLANRQQIDSYLQAGKADYERLRQATRDADPMWYQKLYDARRSAA